MTRMHTITLVSCVVLLLAASGTVAAQETATASAPTETTAAAAPTTASKSPNETTYYSDVAGDCAMRIVSTEHTDGIAVLVLESGLPRAVIVTAPAGSTSVGAAVGNLVRRPIPPGWTTIRIGSPEPRVTLVTSYSAENGRYTGIRFGDGGSAPIAGPLTKTGMRSATIDDALGTSFGAFLIIVRRCFGLHRDMGRVA